MAHHQTCRALLILFTFQLYIVSLYANPQTFVPLIRDRAIRHRQQTSEEDLKTTIKGIFQKDFKMTAPPKHQSTDEVEPSPTELVVRSHASGTTRPFLPIGNNEQKALVYVVRDADGKLVPKYSDTLETKSSDQTIPSTPSQPESQSFNESNVTLVLKVATLSNETHPTFANESYPEGYPFEMIERILHANNGSYRHLFDSKFKPNPLATRANSEGDLYLCSSNAHIEYPTFHNKTKRYIINQPGFYQPLVYETCANNGTRCSKVTTSASYKLICLQTYRDYKMFVAPLDSNSSTLDFIDFRFPACCKCAQIPVGSKSP